MLYKMDSGDKYIYHDKLFSLRIKNSRGPTSTMKYIDHQAHITDSNQAV